jgi:hypothetical protein
METWLPQIAVQTLPRWLIERHVRKMLRPMRCRWHGGTIWLQKFGWSPTEWEINSNCCWASREKAWSDVYWELVGVALSASRPSGRP